MPEMLMMYEPGDRFGTMAKDGHVTVWTVNDYGRLKPVFGLEPKPLQGPHSRACGIGPHEHGTTCAHDCPTCYGKPIEEEL